MGYETFVVPDDVGGRFSVLTAVGLLPIAVAGIDIDELMQGAADAREKYSNPSLKDNDCYKYAAMRNALYNKGKNVEVLVNYEPSLHYFKSVNLGSVNKKLNTSTLTIEVIRL